MKKLKKMKIKLLFLFLLFGVLFCNAQTAAIKDKVIDNDCPPPTENDYKALCADIGSKSKVSLSEYDYYEFTFEKRILELACVDVKTDDEETIKKKVQIFWNKYKTKCKCDSVDFMVQNGNLLKFALSQLMPSVIETLADTYALDINFIDVADDRNVLDYVNKKIRYLSTLINSEGTIKIYEEYKVGIIGLGGKPSK